MKKETAAIERLLNPKSKVSYHYYIDVLMLKISILKCISIKYDINDL